MWQSSFLQLPDSSCLFQLNNHQIVSPLPSEDLYFKSSLLWSQAPDPGLNESDLRDYVFYVVSMASQFHTRPHPFQSSLINVPPRRDRATAISGSHLLAQSQETHLLSVQTQISTQVHSEPTPHNQDPGSCKALEAP